MQKLPDILLISRATLYKQPGGDTVQIEQTAAHLRRLGFKVDIAINPKRFNPGKYDLVHFFNLTRPADLLPYLPQIKRLVVSSIYVDYSAFEKHQAGVLRGLVRSLLGKHGTEYLKTLMRWLNGSDKFPGWQYLLMGQEASIRKILKRTEAVITASQFEKRMIIDDFTAPNLNLRVIRLGSEHFVPEGSKSEKMDVACMARIEGLKNQLGLIKAVKKTTYRLDLYGIVAGNQKSYIEKCQKEGIGRVNFKGQHTHEELQKTLPLYQVHALPSFFETTGLASLEALASGCQIVVSDQPIQKELFREHAYYCDPKNTDSIAAAISAAMKSEVNHSQWVRENFSWKAAAGEISDLYLNPPA